MTFSNVRYEFDHYGYPIVALNYNGKEARVYFDQKPDLVNMGYIIFNPTSTWEDGLTPLLVPEDPDIGRPSFFLFGAIYSVELARFYWKTLRKIKDGTFEAGPVDFP